jgi:TPR repeat protein
MQDNMYPSALEVGTRLNNDTYEIIKVLGQGGFGITYEAMNLSLDRRIALKEFFVENACGRAEDGKTVVVPLEANKELFEIQRNKFIGEAKKLAKLHNKHLVTVYAFFNENDTSYFEMDYVEGQSLRDWLNENQTPMDEGTVRLIILDQMLEALECIHNQNPPLCHLDIKPENIMVDLNDENIVLIDFGASKYASNKGGSKLSSMVVYSPGFAPMEQLASNLKNMGPWTDFYALGGTMFTMLTGYDPYEPTEIMADPSPTKESTIPLPPYLSDQMKELILWMMKPLRTDRPQSVEEIREFLGGPSIPQPTTPEEMFNRGEEYYYGSNGNAQDYDQAAEWYRKAAEEDFVEAQYKLGAMCQKGMGGAQNDAEAAEWYRKAANHGHVTAQYNLGQMYLDGVGVEKDLEQAAQWFLKAANQGDANAQDCYGQMCQDGEGVEKDEREAVKWFRKAANQGNANAQNSLGFMCRNGLGGLEKSDDEAAKWYRKAADQGHPGAQNNLAFMYQNGFGVPKNNKEALKWYEKSAKQGNNSALFNLAIIYMNGEGVGVNPQNAVRFFKEAAEKGHAGAQYYLGQMYQSGQGVPFNLEYALDWYAKSAGQGHVYAQYNLALMYKEGQGTVENEEEAFKWFLKAAEQGHVDSQYHVAMMYKEGQGTEQDDREAVKWFREAAGQGFGQAQYHLAMMCKDGQGTEKNEKEAVNWFRKVADKGHALAQCELGKMYYDGIGVKKDDALAKKWLKMSANQGNVEAKNMLNVILEEEKPKPPVDVPPYDRKKRVFFVCDGRKYELRPGMTTFGRRAKTSVANIQIEDPYNYMSRHHADVRVAYDGYLPRVTVRSVNEKNLVKVNGVKLPIYEEKILNNHDQLTMGDKKLTLLIE